MNVTVYSPVTSALLLDGFIVPVIVVCVAVPLLAVLFDSLLTKFMPKGKDSSYFSLTFAAIVGTVLFAYFMP